MPAYKISPYSQDAPPSAVSPEGALIANTYLAQGCDVEKVSQALMLPQVEVSTILDQPLIKRYISTMLRDASHRNMVKIAKKLDEIIQKKLDELDEASIGSNKDISDLLALAHKMQLDHAKLMQTSENSNSGPSAIHNTQINQYGEGSYGKLMEKLIKG